MSSISQRLKDLANLLNEMHLKGELMIRPAAFQLPPSPEEDPWGLLHRLADLHGRTKSSEVIELFSYLLDKQLPAEITEAEWKALLPGQGLEIDDWMDGRTAWDLRQGVSVVASKRHCVSCLREGGIFQAVWQSAASGGYCTKHGELLSYRCQSCSALFTWDQGTLLTCRCGSSLITPTQDRTKFRIRRNRPPSPSEIEVQTRFDWMEKQDQTLADCYAAPPHPLEFHIDPEVAIDGVDYATKWPKV